MAGVRGNPWDPPAEDVEPDESGLIGGLGIVDPPVELDPRKLAQAVRRC